MSRYIKVEDAIEAAINGCASWDGGYFPSMDDPVKEEFDAVADKCIELVRCGECKHFIEPSWECRKLIDRDAYGEADARVYPDYFCADGERKDGEHDHQRM